LVFGGSFAVLAAITLMALAQAGIRPEPEQEGRSGLRISVLFNNVPQAPGLKTAWGFAAVVEVSGQTLLFDTGGDGRLLLGNMERMGIHPEEIDAVFLSHVHGDHVGGLVTFLRRNPRVAVYMPATFPDQLQAAVTKEGARLAMVTAPTRLFDRVYSTGPMGNAPDEQALILDTPRGLVVITGCAHPGIVEMTRAARRQHAKPVRLVLGGFHMLRQSESRIRAAIRELKELGVAQVAPSHCTGERATALFHDAWGADFLEAGLGAVIELAP
jgi:7,8-dihydropterin-6-yl-methyl-4-(beta-D-ribofuranosyl)aminobenzene 5'-phosphate synthase